MKAFVTATILIFCATLPGAAQDFYVQGRLRDHVEYLCNPSFEGRKAGTEGERTVAAYIFDRFSEAGLTMLCPREGQDFKVGEISSRNVVGIVEGYDSFLRDEYVVVGAHMDALGSIETLIDGKKTARIYPGADDNASGVALLIETARLAAANPWLFARSVVFVAFGASECGTAGSWYFINRAFPQPGAVKAFVNLDMLGRGNGKNPFRIWSNLQKTSLEAILERTAADPVVTPPELFSGTVQTSDHLPFFEKEIPVFLLTTGRTNEYRTTDDTPSLLLYPQMERACNYLFYFIRNLAAERELLSLHPSETSPAAAEPVFTPQECDKRPQFFHNDERHFLSSWVYKYLRYPEEAVREGIQGKVMVAFTIESNGRVSQVRVERGVDPLLDAEAVRVVAASPDWIPGKVKGRPVPVRIVVPVEFRLSEKSKFGIKK